MLQTQMEKNNNSTVSQSTAITTSPNHDDFNPNEKNSENTTNTGSGQHVGGGQSEPNPVKDSVSSPLTLGEIRMRVKIQPGNNDKVHNIRERAAKRINHLEAMKQKRVSDSERSDLFRVIALAQTKTQEAAQYEELAATFEEVDI